MHKKLFFSAAFVIASFSSCESKDDGCKALPPDPNVYCTADYRPVCGCDGETYSNSCQAEIRGIEDYSEGACD